METPIFQTHATTFGFCRLQPTEVAKKRKFKVKNAKWHPIHIARPSLKGPYLWSARFGSTTTDLTTFDCRVGTQTNDILHFERVWASLQHLGKKLVQSSAPQEIVTLDPPLSNKRPSNYNSTMENILAELPIDENSGHGCYNNNASCSSSMMSAFFADLSVKGVGEDASSGSLPLIVVDNARLPADTLLRLEGSFRDLNCTDFEGRQRSFRVERQSSSGSRKDTSCRWERMVRAAKEDTNPGLVRPMRTRTGSDDIISPSNRNAENDGSPNSITNSPGLRRSRGSKSGRNSNKHRSKSPERFDESSHRRRVCAPSRIRSNSPRRM